MMTKKLKLGRAGLFAMFFVMGMIGSAPSALAVLDWTHAFEINRPKAPDRKFNPTWFKASKRPIHPKLPHARHAKLDQVRRAAKVSKKPSAVNDAGSPVVKR